MGKLSVNWLGIYLVILGLNIFLQDVNGQYYVEEEDEDEEDEVEVASSTLSTDPTPSTPSAPTEPPFTDLYDQNFAEQFQILIAQEKTLLQNETLNSTSTVNSTVTINGTTVYRNGTFLNGTSIPHPSAFTTTTTTTTTAVPTRASIRTTEEPSRSQVVGSGVGGILSSIATLNIPGIVSSALSLGTEIEEDEEDAINSILRTIFCIPVLNNLSTCTAKLKTTPAPKHKQKPKPKPKPTTTMTTQAPEEITEAATVTSASAAVAGSSHTGVGASVSDTSSKNSTSASSGNATTADEKARPRTFFYL